MPIVKNRASITVNHVFVAGAPFQYKLNVGFDADEVIVRYVTYGQSANQVDQSVIQTDFIQTGDGIIAHVFPNRTALSSPYANTTCPNAIFQVKKGKSNSTVTFSILSSDVAGGLGLISDPLADGTLFITLEFIQYN
jgi:hypothetical protein